MAISGEKKEDRRKKPRVECSETVNFVINGNSYKGILDSMGVGGFFINTDKSFSVGEKVKVSFYSIIKKGHVNFSGEIMRANVKGFAVKISGGGSW